MKFEIDPLVRCLLAALAFLALALPRLSGLRRFQRFGWWLAGAAGLIAYLNFGIFRHWEMDGFVNAWEQFHYQLGSKYFPELRFDGLYAASLAAQEQSAHERPLPQWVRDLERNLLVPTHAYRSQIWRVTERFDPERWQEFVADHDVYLANVAEGRFWSEIRLDHGYNPSPTWTSVARLFSARLPPGWTSLMFLASLDVVVMAALFWLVFTTFGYRVGCSSLAIAGLGFGWEYIYLGAFLRLDWLLAVVAGVCLLERRRFTGAGACFGYATVVRMFPILLLTGPLLLAAKALLRGERPAWALRFGAGFGATLALGVVVGALGTYGPDVWGDFARRLQEYRRFYAPNMVGMDMIIQTGGPELLRRFGPPEALYYLGPISSEMLEERRVIALVAKAGALVLAAVAMWRSSLVPATVLGCFVIFTLTMPPVYYWILLLLTPMAPSGATATLGLLGLSALLHAVMFLWNHGVYIPAWYGLHAWFLLLFFAAISLAAALARDGGATREAAPRPASG